MGGQHFSVFLAGSDWVALITTITVGLAFIFSFVGGFLTNKFGRRPAILFASLVFTVGAITMGAAPTKEVLLVGRLVCLMPEVEH